MNDDQYMGSIHEARAFILREVMMYLQEQGVNLPEDLEAQVRKFIRELRSCAYIPNPDYWQPSR